MDSVIATVSGYHGSERHNLIKLISVHHSFGKKYELAIKLKTCIVNHKWIEDCIKQCRRVSDRPYTKQCGKEVGPLQLEVSVADKISLLPKQSFAHNRFEESVIDIECSESENEVWTDSWLLKEKLLPDCRKSKNGSNRSKRKGIKRSGRQETSTHSRYSFDESPRSGSRGVESEDFSSSPTHILRQKRRSTNCTTSSEPTRKGRKLVKKNIYRELLDSSSDSEQECHPTQNFHQNEATPSNYSFDGSNERKRESTEQIQDSAKSRADFLNDADEIEDLNIVHNLEDISSAKGDKPSLIRNPQNHCSTVHRDSEEFELVPQMTTSPELSCVICHTEFSSTRGVLACGHRFCFSCIQSWADHMASMRKISTCPLCKASFVCIQKVDDAASADQKVY